MEKNATESDLRRRFYNNGIAKACIEFKRNSESILALLMKTARDICNFVDLFEYSKKVLKSYIKSAIGKENVKPDWRDYKFNRSLRRGKAKVNWQLLTSAQVRKFVRREEWISE